MLNSSTKMSTVEIFRMTLVHTNLVLRMLELDRLESQEVRRVPEASLLHIERENLP